MAVDMLTRQKLQLKEEWNAERATWQTIKKQSEDVISSLAEQLRKTDNESQVLQRKLEAAKKELQKLQNQLTEHCKTNKALNKKVKRLKTHISRCNETLDDVICDGDYLLDR